MGVQNMSQAFACPGALGGVKDYDLSPSHILLGPISRGPDSPGADHRALGELPLGA